MDFLKTIDDFLLAKRAAEDHRVDGLPLMTSFSSIFCIILAYITMSYFGIKCMLNRKPFQLSYILIIYDLIISSLSLYIMCQILLGVFRRNYNWICEPVHYGSMDSEELRIIENCHLFMVCKLLELFDTFFFIIRKREKQLIAVHYYHHLLMLLGSWFIVRFIPGGTVFFVVVINSMVHFILYLNHALVLLKFTPIYNSWWKIFLLFITKFQTGVLLFQLLLSLLTGCADNKGVNYFLVYGILSLVCLHLINLWKNRTSKKSYNLKNYTCEMLEY